MEINPDTPLKYRYKRGDETELIQGDSSQRLYVLIGINLSKYQDVE